MKGSDLKSDAELQSILTAALQPKGTLNVVRLSFATSAGYFDMEEITAAITTLRKNTILSALDPDAAKLNPLERIALRLLAESAGIDLNK